jgi:hypothetical protein
MRTSRLLTTMAAAAVLGTVVAGAGCARFSPRSRASGPESTPEGIKFRFYAPSASRVQLAGNWPENNWARGDGSAGEADVGLMTVDREGMWEIVVRLGAGRYQYLFWVDENTWHLDPGCLEEVSGGPHGVTSLLMVFERGGELEVR